MPSKTIKDTSSIDYQQSNLYKKIYPPTRCSTRGQQQVDTTLDPHTPSSTVTIPRAPVHPSALRDSHLFSPLDSQTTTPQTSPPGFKTTTPRTSPKSYNYSSPATSREPSPIRMGDQVANQPTLRSQFIPLNIVPGPVVVPARANVEKFKISHCLRAALPSFHGFHAEKPYEHIANCDQLMLSMNEQIWSRCFMSHLVYQYPSRQCPTLVRSLQPGSITTWQEMYKEFLLKYNPHTKTIALKTQIKSFKLCGNETFHNA